MVASCRSPVIRTSVMVTMPRRGSLIWVSIMLATICLIRPASLRARGPSAICLSLSIANYAYGARSEQILVGVDAPPSGQHRRLHVVGDHSLAAIQHLHHM